MSDSTPTIVVSGGVRYRAEDAERLGLKADPKARATEGPSPADALAAAQAEAATIVAAAHAEAATIRAANATTKEGDTDGGKVSGEAGGPGDDAGDDSDGPKSGTRTKASK